MFQCLSVERARSLITEVDGNMDDAIELAFDVVNNSPSTSGSSPFDRASASVFGFSAVPKRSSPASSSSAELSCGKMLYGTLSNSKPSASEKK